MTGGEPTFDVVVLGAGVSGLSQLKRCLELDAPVLALEVDEHLGGTPGNANDV
jgi:cation diffusion facilitator CzcD-associated flavoprotein CzcO